MTTGPTPSPRYDRLTNALLVWLLISLMLLAASLSWALLGAASPEPTAIALATGMSAAIQAVTATPAATPTPPCNGATLITDGAVAMIPIVEIGQPFTYTWRLKNSGLCTWNADYEIFFVVGSDLGGPPIQKLGTAVSPGQVVEITLQLTAPASPGDYVATYQLRSDDGSEFGLGREHNQVLWVSIRAENNQP